MDERSAVYLNDWADGQEAEMLSDFSITKDDIAGVSVIVASYTQEDYSGSAYVLFERDGKLFEVHGGHCSCYGLEDQWEPEDADRDSILHRIENGTWYADEPGVKDYVLAALRVSA